MSARDRRAAIDRAMADPVIPRLAVTFRTEPDDGRRWTVEVSAADRQPIRHARIGVRAAIVLEGPIPELRVVPANHECEGENCSLCPFCYQSENVDRCAYTCLHDNGYERWPDA